MNFKGKTIEEAIKTGLETLGVKENEVDITTIQEPVKGILGFGSKEAIIDIVLKETSIDSLLEDEVIEEVKETPVVEETPVEKESTTSLSEEEKAKKIQKAKDFLFPLLKELGYQVECFFKEDADFIKVNIKGRYVGNLIGKRGETLYALQYLLNLVANRNDDNNLKFIIDVEDFRRKRERTLNNLANRLAEKVKETGEPVALEPMNPLERKIIHLALQDNPYVDTVSEGLENTRHIKIIPKTQN